MGGGLLRQGGQQDRALFLAEVTQGVGGLVGFHPREQPGRVAGVGFGQQLMEFVRVHFLQRVRGGLRLDQVQELLALPAAKILQEVGQLRGTQRVQLPAVPGQPGPALAGVRPERLHRGPVDHHLRGRAGAPAGGPQPAQQRPEADIHPDQPHGPAHGGQVQIRRPHHAGPVDVHELVIEHRTGEGRFPLARHEVP